MFIRTFFYTSIQQNYFEVEIPPTLQPIFFFKKNVPNIEEKIDAWYYAYNMQDLLLSFNLYRQTSKILLSVQLCTTLIFLISWCMLIYFVLCFHLSSMASNYILLFILELIFKI